MITQRSCSLLSCLSKPILRRSKLSGASFLLKRHVHEETRIQIPDFSQEFKGMDVSFPCLTEQATRYVWFIMFCLAVKCSVNLNGLSISVHRRYIRWPILQI